MNRRAQAGLEYLMTYGWALVIVATIVGVLIFVALPPTQHVSFSSSNPGKILLKSGSVGADGSVAAVAQNATGGPIEVIFFYTSGDFFGSKLNGVESTAITPAVPLEVAAGSELRFTEISYIGAGSVDGGINILYTDFADQQRSATISGRGTTTEPPGIQKITECDFLDTSDGNYVLTADLSTGSDTCLTLADTGGKLNCAGHSVAASNYAIYLAGIAGRVSNCVVSGGHIYSEWVRDNEIISNTITGAGQYGIYPDLGSVRLVAENTITNRTYGIYATTGNIIFINNNASNNARNFYCTGSNNIAYQNTFCSGTDWDAQCTGGCTNITGSGNKANSVTGCTFQYTGC